MNVWQKYITDGEGNVIEGAEVQVFTAGTSTPITIYKDKNGTSLWPSKTATTDENGYVRLYAPAGFYDIKATSPVGDATFEDVPLGNLQGMDEADIRITESQITDLGNYATVTHTHPAGDIVSGTFADARIAESNVTQHEAALSLTFSQLTDSIADGQVPQSAVTQHEAALTITESQISDLAHYTSADFDADFSGKSTSDLSEGTNLYFTNERVDDRVAALLVGGNNVTLTYDDGANTLTIDASGGLSASADEVITGNWTFSPDGSELELDTNVDLLLKNAGGSIKWGTDASIGYGSPFGDELYFSSSMGHRFRFGDVLVDNNDLRIVDGTTSIGRLTARESASEDTLFEIEGMNSTRVLIGRGNTGEAGLRVPAFVYGWDAPNYTGATAGVAGNASDALLEIFNFIREPSALHTPADGDGLTISIALPESNEEVVNYANINVIADDVTAGSEDASFTLELMSAGTLTQCFKVNANGDLIVPDNLPTSNPTVAGQVWNDSGTLKVSAG